MAVSQRWLILSFITTVSTDEPTFAFCLVQAPNYMIYLCTDKLLGLYYNEACFYQPFVMYTSNNAAKENMLPLLPPQSLATSCSGRGGVHAFLSLSSTPS
jgi:hypothetical protein